jgi:Cu/Ag efflux pump CusA
VGLTTRDVTNSLVVNLAGSGQVAPTYWLNPANGVTYNIVMQTPQYRLDSLASLSNLPIMAPAASQLQVLGGIADIRRDTANAVVSQYDLQGVVQVYAGVQGRDLGSVAADVRAIVRTWRPSNRSPFAPSKCRVRSRRWSRPSPACCSGSWEQSC